MGGDFQCCVKLANGSTPKPYTCTYTCTASYTRESLEWRPYVGHTEIIVHRPVLDPQAMGYYAIRAIGRLLLRTSMIWGGIAILAPQLGVAWYAVFIVLVMLNHLLWVRTDASVIAANNAARANTPVLARSKGTEEAQLDNELFMQRVKI